MREVSSEKISALRDIILDKADENKRGIVSEARKEAEDWLSSETEKLEREKNIIVRDGRKRAEEIRRRQIMAAERDKSADMLRLHNRILTEALGRLQDGLVHLRDREDYADILTGMCIEAAQSLKGADTLKMRLAAVDLNLAKDIIARIKKRDAGIDIVFDPEPAPILGGCWVVTEDRRRQVSSDWQSMTQEMADTLAGRLLPLL